MLENCSHPAKVVFVSETDRFARLDAQMSGHYNLLIACARPLCLRRISSPIIEQLLGLLAPPTSPID